MGSEQASERLSSTLDKKNVKNHVIFDILFLFLRFFTNNKNKRGIYGDVD